MDERDEVSARLATREQLERDLWWAAELVARAFHSRVAVECGHRAFPDGYAWDDLPASRRLWWTRATVSLLADGLVEIGPMLHE